MVDFLKNRVGETLTKARTITHSEIWRMVFDDPGFRKQLLDWVRYDQLFEKGVDEDNEIIGFYSEWTELLNPSKVAGTHYTLYDTGEFYSSFYLVVTNDSFIIDADPIKTDENGDVTNLFKEYGDGIVGLNEESRAKLAFEISKRYAQIYRRLLFGN